MLRTYAPNPYGGNVIRFPEYSWEKLPLKEWPPGVTKSRALTGSAYLGQPLSLREIQNFLEALDAIPPHRRSESWQDTYQEYKDLVKEGFQNEQYQAGGLVSADVLHGA